PRKVRRRLSPPVTYRCTEWRPELKTLAPARVVQTPGLAWRSAWLRLHPSPQTERKHVNIIDILFPGREEAVDQQPHHGSAGAPVLPAGERHRRDHPRPDPRVSGHGRPADLRQDLSHGLPVRLGLVPYLRS